MMRTSDIQNESIHIYFASLPEESVIKIEQIPCTESVHRIQELISDFAHLSMNNQTLRCDGRILQPNEMIADVRQSSADSTAKSIDLTLEISPEGWSQRMSKVTSVSDVLQEIKTLQSECNRLYSAFANENKILEKRKYFGSFDIVQGLPVFSVKEEVMHVDACVFAMNFRPNTCAIQPIQDYFNSKINYQVETVTELMQLGKEMLPEVMKYSALLDEGSRRVNTVIQQFLHNYHAIYSILWDVRTLIPTSDESKWDTYKASQTLINQQLRGLAEANVEFTHSTVKYLDLEDKLGLKKQEKEALKNWFPDCKVSLLYDMKRDGSTLRSFVDKCKGNGPILIIVRTAGDEVFGAYVSVSWKATAEGFANTNGYIFALRVKDSIAAELPAKYVPQPSSENRVFCHVVDVAETYFMPEFQSFIIGYEGINSIALSVNAGKVIICMPECKGAGKRKSPSEDNGVTTDDIAQLLVWNVSRHDYFFSSH